MLTVKEAWLWIAEQCDKAAEAGSDYIEIQGYFRLGLCSVLHRMQDCDDLVALSDLNVMEDQLDKEIAIQGCHRFLYPTTPYGNLQRAALCRRFAEEIEESIT